MEKVKKVPKRENFTTIKGILEEVGRTDLVAVMEHEIELLAKKNASGTTKQTNTQAENEGIKAEILECMCAEPNRMFTISEMLKLFPCCAELSNQKVSALMKQLKEDGKVKRLEEKRKAYFQVI